MDKKTVKKIVSTIVALAILTMIFSFCGLIFDAITARDPITIDPSKVTEEIKDITNHATWMLVALACLLLPTLVCYGFSLFGKSKIMTIVSAVMSLFVVVTCIAFFFVLRDYAVVSAEAYAIAAAVYPYFILLISTGTLLCAFFTYESVMVFVNDRKAKCDHASTTERQSINCEQTANDLSNDEINTEETNKNEEN